MTATKADSEALKVLTTEFRVSHPHVFTPTAIQGSDKKTYSIEMLFDKSTTDIKTLTRPLYAAATEKWGPKENWPQPLNMPIRDGDKPKRNTKTKEMEVKPEHKGMWVVKASSDAQYSKPQVVKPNPKLPITDPAEFYPGCYARASLKAHAYTFADKEGVKFILDGVQKIREGQALGGKKPADQVFGMLDDNEDGFGNEETNEEEMSF